MSLLLGVIAAGALAYGLGFATNRNSEEDDKKKLNELFKTVRLCNK